MIPISWTNRTTGEAKLAMQEMGSRYLFIVLYVWLEQHPQPRRLPGRPAAPRSPPSRDEELST